MFQAAIPVTKDRGSFIELESIESVDNGGESNDELIQDHILNQDTLKLPELQFLSFILTVSKEEQHRYIKARIKRKSDEDYAAELSQMPVGERAMNRIPAILLTLTIEIMVGIVISKYHTLIQKQILISSFIPVLSSISGNIGLQSSVATTRALSTGHIRLSQWGNCVFQELLCSMIIGCLACLLVFIISLMWSSSLNFSISTSFGLFVSSSFAGVIGTIGPIIFRLLKRDGALMAGPFETAMQDFFGTCIYLALAYKLLN